MQSGIAQETNTSPAGAEADAPAEPARPPVDPAVEPSLKRAESLMKEGNLHEAKTALQTLTGEFPDDPDVRRLYSLILIQGKEMKKAIDLIQPLLGTVYADFVILNNAAWIYATIPDREVRNSARALELAQEALLINPTNYHIWSTLAEAHYASGQFDRAVKASAEALRLAELARAAAPDVKEIREQALKIKKAAEALALIE